MADGRPFITGKSFSFADVQGMTVLAITDIFDLSAPDDCLNVRRWEKTMRDRPSWHA